MAFIIHTFVLEHVAGVIEKPPVKAANYSGVSAPVYDRNAVANDPNAKS